MATYGNKSTRKSQSIHKPKQLGIDKFYTKPNIAKQCVSIFAKAIEVSSDDLIVEPSAGNGSFIKPLKRIKCSKVFIDIAPESNLVTKADFFS